MRLRLALLGVAALVPLLLAEVQEHEALRFCSDKEASKRDLFKSYWRKCSTEAFNQFGVAELGSAAKIANRLAIKLAFRDREGMNKWGKGVNELDHVCSECLEPLRGLDRRPRKKASLLNDDDDEPEWARRLLR